MRARIGGKVHGWIDAEKNSEWPIPQVGLKQDLAVTATVHSQRLTREARCDNAQSMFNVPHRILKHSIPRVDLKKGCRFRRCQAGPDWVA